MNLKTLHKAKSMTALSPSVSPVMGIKQYLFSKEIFDGLVTHNVQREVKITYFVRQIHLITSEIKDITCTGKRSVMTNIITDNFFRGPPR